jgi:hypothetical protein
MMANVMHFMPEGWEKAACGAAVFLCADYTDAPEDVDCRRCRRTKAFKNYDPTRFDVDVWNHDGDVVRWFKRVTAEEVEEIRQRFEDDPLLSVVVEEA